MFGREGRDVHRLQGVGVDAFLRHWLLGVRHLLIRGRRHRVRGGGQGRGLLSRSGRRSGHFPDKGGRCIERFTGRFKDDLPVAILVEPETQAREGHGNFLFAHAEKAANPDDH